MLTSMCRSRTSIDTGMNVTDINQSRTEYSAFHCPMYSHSQVSEILAPIRVYNITFTLYTSEALNSTYTLREVTQLLERQRPTLFLLYSYCRLLHTLLLLHTRRRLVSFSVIRLVNNNLVQ